MKKESSDLTSLPASLDRREFLVTSILAGAFALAVQPIQAETRITTDAIGLTVGEVKIPVADGVIPAYRAMPDKKNKRFPVVLVIHEIFGVHEWIQDVSGGLRSRVIWQSRQPCMPDRAKFLRYKLRANSTARFSRKFPTRNQ